MDKDHEDELAAEIAAQHRPHWDAYLATHDIEKLWSTFGDIAEKYLADRSNVPLHKHRGRGEYRRPRTIKLTAPQEPRFPGQYSMRSRQLGKLVNLVREVHRQTIVNPNLHAHVYYVWDKAVHLGRRIQPTVNWPAAPPSVMGLKIREAYLCDALWQMLQEEQNDRVTAYTEHIRTEFRTRGGKKVFDWLLNRTKTPVTIVGKADGTYTGNVQEIDEMVRAAWKPIIEAYRDRPEPDVHNFLARFGQYIVPPQAPMELPPLDCQALRATLARMEATETPGPDGWRVTELKKLPDPIMKMLAEMLMVIERHGIWPRAVTRSSVTLIPKPNGTGPLDMRPLSVTSAVYRLWAATRVRDASTWQEGWIHDSQCGFRRRKSTAHLYLRIGLTLEKAAVNGEPALCASLDFSKCFDRVPHGILLAVAEAAGLHRGVAGPLRHMYANLSRRYKIGPAVGAEHTATNGLLQGCPLSPILLNSLLSCWTRAIEAASLTTPASYADDMNLLSTGRDAKAEMQKALEVADDYIGLTEQELNVAKSSLTTIPTGYHDIPNLQGNIFRRKTIPKIVGAELDVRLTAPVPQCHPGLTEKLKGLLFFLARVETLPLTRKEKCDVLTCVFGPRLVYAAEVQHVSMNKRLLLRTQLAHAIFGNKHHLRYAPELAMILLTRGHQTCPIIAINYKRMKALHTITADPQLRDAFAGVWNNRFPGRRPACSPTRIVEEALRELGWELHFLPDTAMAIVIPSQGNRLIELDLPAPSFDHELRDALRTTYCLQLARRRPAYAQLAGGIDRDATTHLLERHDLPDLHVGFLRRLLVGSVITRKWWYENELKPLVPSPLCPHCQQGDEDLNHLFWVCECWDDTRRQHPEALAAQPILPQVLRDRAVVPQMWAPDRPPGPAFHGIPPHALRKRIASAVQRMQVAVLMARAAARRDGAAGSSSTSSSSSSDTDTDHHGYPFGWRPAGTRLDIPDFDPFARGLRSGKGRVFANNVLRWLRSLVWPPANTPHATAGITVTELLLDYEAWTGTDVPPSGSSGRYVDTLSARSHVLHTQVKKLIAIAPTPLIMGTVGTSKALRPLIGRNHLIQGWTRRPVFSGGQATDDAIRLTIMGAALRNMPGRPLGLQLDWQKQLPKHREDLRRGNLAIFLAGGGEQPLPPQQDRQRRHAQTGPG